MSSRRDPWLFRRTALGLVVLFSLASLGQGASATSDSVPDRTDEVPEYPNDPAKAPSVRSLKDDYGLSTAQAIDQMETQVAAGVAYSNLPAQLKEVYSGREMHHEDGARVVVALTDSSRSEPMREHFASYGVDNIDIQVVEHTKQYLDVTTKEMQRRLSNSAKPEANRNVLVSRRSLGKVTVRFVDGPMSATEKDILDEARSAPATFTVSEVDHLDRLETVACDRTDNIECDAPLRGSVWIHDPGGTGSNCSAGFNVKSSSDDKPYVLTAGHCDDGEAGPWWTREEDGSIEDIGGFHNSEYSTDVDAGILNVDSPFSWNFGKPWITLNPNEGGHGPDDTYEITRVANPGEMEVGERACMTGGDFPATTCGDITATCRDGDVTECVFEVSGDGNDGDSAYMCAEPGDSGSPVFSLGVAFGIVHAEEAPRDNDCDNFIGGEQAHEAADAMNVYIVTS